MSIENDDTANKIRNVFEKKLRMDLENQLGSVSDEVYYKVRDTLYQGRDSEMSNLYRTVEESTKTQLEKMQSKSKNQYKEESNE